MHDYSKGIVSVDTETLAHSTDAVMLSIGICFHPWSKPDLEFMKKNSLQIKLDIKDQIDRGMKTQPDVIQWWKEQSPEARQILVPKAGDVKLIDVPKIIDDWFLSIGVKWHQTDTFDRRSYDMSKLQHIYEQILGIKTPWNHGHIYEFGTALAFMGSDRYGGIREPSEVDPSFVYHNSRHDAIVDCYRLLNTMDKNGVL